MTQSQLQQWRAIFNSVYARLAQQIDEREAKSRAAAAAWIEMKKKGVRTKLQVFGKRDVEILRDRGVLFNAISPGIVSEAGVDANYSPPTGQSVEFGNPGEVVVGVNVAYARYHQGTAEKPGRRPLWPPDGNLPQVWWDDILDAAVLGVLKLAELLK